MPIYAVTYGYSPTEAAGRDRVRPDHRAFLAEQDGLLLSGPTDDGALLLFEAKSAVELEDLLDEDPFWTEHLVAERTIVEWKPVTGPWRDTLNLD
ncbi:YciI family protein [Nocardioides sp.]|uniref:YciI family protein n=1 Tax=Nocardioides sp. TaxID=35761 RepID=UPI00260DCF28|nr:YciI family protein [Nocardioides sp.]